MNYQTNEIMKYVKEISFIATEIITLLLQKLHLKGVRHGQADKVTFQVTAH